MEPIEVESMFERITKIIEPCIPEWLIWKVLIFYYVISRVYSQCVHVKIDVTPRYDSNLIYFPICLFLIRQTHLIFQQSGSNISCFLRFPPKHQWHSFQWGWLLSIWVSDSWINDPRGNKIPCDDYCFCQWVSPHFVQCFDFTHIAGGKKWKRFSLFTSGSESVQVDSVR